MDFVGLAASKQIDHNRRTDEVLFLQSTGTTGLDGF